MPRLSLLVCGAGSFILMVDELGSKHSKSARQAKQAGYTTGRVDVALERTKESELCLRAVGWREQIGGRSVSQGLDAGGSKCQMPIVILSSEFKSTNQFSDLPCASVDYAIYLSFRVIGFLNNVA